MSDARSQLNPTQSCCGDDKKSPAERARAQAKRATLTALGYGSDVCKDGATGAIVVTISGKKSLRLAGFDNSPDVYVAWYGGDGPTSIPVTPNTSGSGIGYAQLVKASSTVFEWGPVSYGFPDTCTTGATFKVTAVIWHRYESLGDLHMLIETVTVEKPCNDIEGCPE